MKKKRKNLAQGAAVASCSAVIEARTINGRGGRLAAMGSRGRRRTVTSLRRPWPQGTQTTTWLNCALFPHSLQPFY